MPSFSATLQRSQSLLGQQVREEPGSRFGRNISKVPCGFWVAYVGVHQWKVVPRCCCSCGGWEKLVKGTSGSTCREGGSHMHPYTWGFPESPPTALELMLATMQDSGRSFPKKSYFSRISCLLQRGPGFTGCAVQDSLDHKPRGLCTEMSTACLSSSPVECSQSLGQAWQCHFESAQSHLQAHPTVPVPLEQFSLRFWVKGEVLLGGVSTVASGARRV